jgi:dephospho-CoA kinase
MPSGRCQRAHGCFVLVAGWPASGKSALAAALAAELGLPLLAKDEIKEALMEVLGRPETVAASQRLGKAAVLAMLRAELSRVSASRSSRNKFPEENPAAMSIWPAGVRRTGE